MGIREEIRKAFEEKKAKDAKASEDSVTARERQVVLDTNKTKEALLKFLSDDYLRNLISRAINTPTTGQTTTLTYQMGSTELAPMRVVGEKMSKTGGPSIPHNLSFPARFIGAAFVDPEVTARMKELRSDGISVEFKVVQPVGPVIVFIDFSKALE